MCFRRVFTSRFPKASSGNWNQGGGQSYNNDNYQNKGNWNNYNNSKKSGNFNNNANSNNKYGGNKFG